MNDNLFISKKLNLLNRHDLIYPFLWKIQLLLKIVILKNCTISNVKPLKRISKNKSKFFIFYLYI